MARGSLFGRIRLVYRRSSTLLKCVVLGMIVFCTVTLVTIAASITQAQRQNENLKDQAAVIEQDNLELIRKIQQLGTEEGIRTIATEVLGLVDPDAVFFEPVDPTNPS